MTLSYEQAFSWISQNPDASVAELKNLVSQVSVDVPGSKTTLLYSGSINNLEAWKIAESIGASNEGVATIGQTDVSKLINDKAFTDVLQDAVDREGLDYGLILEGKNPNGARISNNSMWDIASENFAKNAVGDVKTIAPTAEGGAVFSSTEIPALLENPKVTSVDGIPVAELKATYNSEGIGAVLTKVKQASGGNFALLEIATDPSDGKVITAVGDEKFFEIIPEVTGKALPENAGNIKHGTDILNQDSGWKGFIKELDDLTGTKFLSKSTLAKLGVAGDILSLTFAASSAEAAAENGDHAKAASIMETWTADFLGGAAGGVAAALAIAPVIAALSVGGLIGGALAISVGIVGGVYGGDAGVYLLNKAKELGIVSDQDVIDFTKALQDYLNSLNEDAKTVGHYIADLLASLTQAEATPFNNPRYDPLTLDLDGDGVELISLNKSTAFFDLDNDALREKVGWVKSDDGILVLDSNNNNSVDNITELFGYRGEDGVQVTGTEELRTHDLNNDGKIDANDSIFSKLKIWQDTNQNGISEVNELKTLSDYGITSINVAQSGVTDLNQLQEGNLIISKSTYTKTVTNNDGTTTEVTRDYANLDLAIDQTNSSSYAYQDESGNNVTYDLNLDVLNLPMSRGYGNLKAWHIAMSEDSDLLDIMKEIVSVAAQDSELSYKDLDQKIESFIYQWSHVQDIGLISMRGSFSAQKLAAMEAIRGIVFLGQGAGGNIAPTQVNLVQSAWDSLVKDVTAKVLIQGVFSDLFTSAKYDFATDSIDFGDLSKEVLMQNIKAKFDQLSGSTEQYYFISALSDLAEDVGGKVENIATAEAFKSDLVETLGFRIDDFKLGGIGNDTLNATSSGNYFFDGAEGNDTIISSSGDDIISGGKGDDVIDGGVGNDTYIYNIGDGHDVITDNPSSSINYGDQLTDVISFGVGITVDDLVLSRGGNDLVISFKNSASDSITFKNHFSPYTNSQYRNSKLEYLEFTTLADDGSTNKSRVATNSLVTLSYDGTEENDDIGIYNHAFDGNDIIKTLGGDDKVFADYGNDQLTGGTGDDFLSGYYGDDTYIYNLGDGADTINELSQSASYQRPGSNWEDLGNDTILFGEGISRSDLVFSTPNSRELVIGFRNSTSDKITINNFFAGTNAKVENLKFFDGSFIDISGLDAGNISKYDTTYLENEGGDVLYNLGDGSKEISLSDNKKKIIFGAEIVADDVCFSYQDDKLLIKFKNNSTDQIAVSGYMLSSPAKLEMLQFVDGSQLNISNPFAINFEKSGSGTIYGSSYNDVIIGSDGNDVIYGNSGDDVITGGKGDDKLGGTTNGDKNEGNDTYIFNIGDGRDYIREAGIEGSAKGNDIIKFGAGISKDDIYLTRLAYDLVIKFKNSATDQINIAAHFASDAQRVEKIVFDNGDEIDLTDPALSKIYNGGAGDDVISTMGDEKNIVTGGAGNDTLTGNGSETYIFNLGDGKDVIEDNDYSGTVDSIRFGAGITKDDISFKIQTQLDGVTWRNHFIISFKNNSADQIDLVYRLSYKYHGVEKLEFSDGSVLDISNPYLLDLGQEIQGTQNNDVINAGGGNDNAMGNDGDDIISGQTGDDTLGGNRGNDIYIYNKGDGKDTIVTSSVGYDSGVDKIIFGSGISKDDIYFEGSGDSLLIKFKNSESDQIKISAQLNAAYDKTEFLQFADGETIDLLAIRDVVFKGTDANDSFYGNLDVNEIIDAGAGNDAIYVSSGNDEITGGKGNDFIGFTINNGASGNFGDDTYIYEKGDGDDTIRESAIESATSNGKDTIELGSGFIRSDIYFTASGNDIIINFGNGSITLSNQLRSSADKVESIKFFDGTSLDISTLTAANIAEYNADFILRGPYEYSAGSGAMYISDLNLINSALVFDASIAADNVYFVRINNDLVVRFFDSLSDKITIANQFADAAKHIEVLQFSDGSSLDISDASVLTFLDEPGIEIFGTENNDIISGTNGADYIDGNSGDDTLYGGAGGDSYFFNVGDGKDLIYDTSGLDKIIFGAGISLSDLYFTKTSEPPYNSMIIGFRNNVSDRITVMNYFSYSANKIESLQFSDGSTFNLTNALFEFNGTAGADYINATNENDLINGGDGDDSIDAGTGDNIIDGGNGNDFISAWDGNNNIISGDGDDTIYTQTSYENFTNYINNIDAGNGDDNVRGGNGKEIVDLGEGNDQAYLGAGNDSVDGGLGNDIIYLEDGDDTANGGEGDDIIYGGAGDDAINGGAGNDTLYGDGGNNILTGGSGADIFIFSNDTQGLVITDFAAGDKIDFSQFAQSLYFSDFEIYQDGNDAVIEISGKKITLQNFDHTQVAPANFVGLLHEGGYAINASKFDDEVTKSDHYNLGDILWNDAMKIYGNAGNDKISGWNGKNDVLDGGAGDDALTATAAGSSTMIGGLGQDRFIFDNSNVMGSGSFNNIIEDFDLSEKIILKAVSGIYDFSDLAIVDGIDGAIVSYLSQDSYGNSVENNITLKGIAANELGSQNFEIQSVVLESAGNITTDDSSYFITTNDGNDVIVSGAGDDVVNDYGGSANISTNAGNDEVMFYGKVEGSNTIDLGAGNDQLDSYNYSSALTLNQIFGGEGDDKINIFGFAKNNVAAGAGNDRIYTASDFTNIDAGEGDDFIKIASSNNEIFGGSGNDIFTFEAFGNNTIGDFEINNLNEKIDFQNLGISNFDDLQITQNGADAQINFTSGDSLVLKNIDAAQLKAQNFIFKKEADSASVFEINKNPREQTTITNFTASNKILVKDFSDVTKFSDLAIRYSFDYLSGKYNAAINLGEGQFLFINAIEKNSLNQNSFEFLRKNNAPILLGNISSQSTKEGDLFTLVLPENLFLDSDVDEVLTLSATLSDGSQLPSWLKLENNILSGTPDRNSSGNILIKITATDSFGVSASQDFAIQIEENVELGNVISGNTSNDYIVGDIGSDVISGGEGEDIIRGGFGNDEVNGGIGNDLLGGDVGDDKVFGGEGNDQIYGGLGNDNLYGEEGNDYLMGDSGNDKIYGGAGNDHILGWSGDDVIFGGLGADRLQGGEGKDVFTFESLRDSSLNSSDLIIDFTKGSDKIDFSGIFFHHIIPNASSQSSYGILGYRFDNLSNETVVYDTHSNFAFKLSGKIILNQDDFDF